MSSFIQVQPDHGFGYNNLPYGVFSTDDNPKKRPGVAIGDFVLDLGAVSHFFTGPLMSDCANEVFGKETLNAFIALSHLHWSETRQFIKKILSNEEAFLRDDVQLRKKALIPREICHMHLPVDIGDYTDFYASIDHATNVGKIMRGPANALMPNYVHIPIAYHGRASSIVESGRPIARPSGQTCPPGSTTPTFGACKALDFELEVGCFFGGSSNLLGQPIRMSQAQNHIFGLVLLNDWSARDIQRWEYQPLGPFLAKNFSTTISDWIVPIEALQDFKVPNRVQDPEPLPYLRHDDPFNFDINLEVHYQPSQLYNKSKVICKSNFKHLYWTLKQMLAHHTVSGCNMRPGDLFGTGTISGPNAGSFGSMLELTEGGKKPIEFEQGIQRTYIQDGDLITLHAYCQKEGGEKISFGPCEGVVVPADVARARPSIMISQLD